MVQIFHKGSKDQQEFSLFLILFTIDVLGKKCMFLLFFCELDLKDIFKDKKLDGSSFLFDIREYLMKYLLRWSIFYQEQKSQKLLFFHDNIDDKTRKEFWLL